MPASLTHQSIHMTIIVKNIKKKKLQTCFYKQKQTAIYNFYYSLADQTYTLFVVCELFMALEATIIDIILTSTAKLTMCHGMKLVKY